MIKTNFKIQIPDRVYNKVIYWVKKSSVEISGFGTVVYFPKESTFVIQDAILLKQENGAAHTDIDPASLGKAMYELHQRNAPGELKWWWHSHVNMQTFWSGTDENTIKDLGKNGWIIATVFNKREEQRSAFSCTADIPLLGKSDYFADQLSFEKITYEDKTLIKAWDDEFDLNVKEIKYPIVWKKKDDAIVKEVKIIDDWDAITEEAALLKMTPLEYSKILDGGTEKELAELNRKLTDIYVNMSWSDHYGNN